MAVRIDLTFDTRDAESLAAFWKLALGYVMADPEGNEFCVAA